MIYNKLMRKGVFAAAAAAMLLLAACGERQNEQEPASPTGSADPGSARPTELAPEPSEAPPGGGTDDVGEDESDEDRAEREVVLDSVTEQLMYRGIYYEITGDDTASAVDYYDLELAEIDFPDELAYGGNLRPEEDVGYLDAIRQNRCRI